MVRITNSLLAIAALCASLGIHNPYHLFSLLTSIFFVSVCVSADVVIDNPVNGVISGVTDIVSASEVGASAISVQTDGATLYVVTEVDSFGAFISGGHTSTFLSIPTTTVCESLNVDLSMK